MDLSFELFPQNSLKILCFSNVSNYSEILQNIKTDLEIAIINPRLIASIFHLHIAANLALNSFHSNKLVTKTIHSELLFSLSPSKNISDAFKNFGADSSSSDMIVAAFDCPESKLDQVRSLIKGTEEKVDSIGSKFDREFAIKIYQISGPELENDLVGNMITRITTKGL